MLCQDIGWNLKLAFPPLLFSVREPSAREAAPTTPSPVSPPSQLSTIHLPRARNVAPGHCGACSQSPSSSFHSGFYRLASIPQSAVWDLALKAQTEDSPPARNSSRFILSQHHMRRLRHGGSRNPGVKAGGGQGPPPSHLSGHWLAPVVAALHSCKASASYTQGLPAIHPIHPPTRVPVHAPQASIIGGIRTGLLVGSC